MDSLVQSNQRRSLADELAFNSIEWIPEPASSPGALQPVCSTFNSIEWILNNARGHPVPDA